MKTNFIMLVCASIVLSTQAGYGQRKKDSELRITQKLPSGETTYERTDENGTLYSSPYLYVRRDGKIVIQTEGNLFRYAFSPTKVEVIVNKPFGDSLLDPFSIGGLPGLELPKAAEATKAAASPNKESGKKPKELTPKQVDFNRDLGKIAFQQDKAETDSKGYERKRAAYKDHYRNLPTSLAERRKYLEEIKYTATDKAALTNSTKQVFDDFFRPFSATPSVSLAALLADYANTQVDALKKEVEGPGGLVETYKSLRETLSAIKVMSATLLEENEDDISAADKAKLKKIIAASDEALTNLEKAQAEVIKLHETVRSTDWTLEFTRFWQAKENLINASFLRFYTTTATGDKLVIRQNYKVMSFVDGKLVAGPPETDTAFTIRVKGNMHINVSAGLGFPFRTEDKYVVKPDSPSSTSMGTITQIRGGLGSPYLTTMIDVSWSNYTNVSPVISGGIGYPLTGGSLAFFLGGGIDFDIAGRRVLFHSGISFVKSSILSGGYNEGDNVASNFSIPTETGYRIKPFFAFTYNLSQLK
ncbi:hypothetical protein JYG30_06200 [Fibrella sp. USSR17]